MGIARRITGDFDARIARIDKLMTRAEEIKQVADDQRFYWIAGQMDEFYGELLTIRDEVRSMKRLLLGVLVSILTGTIGIPIALLWNAGIT